VLQKGEIVIGEDPGIFGISVLVFRSSIGAEK